MHICAQNWKTRYCEVDIIAQKAGVMYFVEVKYRKTSHYGDGFDYITGTKLRHMYRAAESWVAIHVWNGEYALLAAAVRGSDTVVEIREIA
jgi:putative endonuclease